MKFIHLALLAFFATFAATVGTSAQSGVYQFGVPSGTTIANCQVVSGQTWFCFPADGTINVSVNGAAFKPYAPANTTGVTSFNGRTGAVLPAAGDYSYQQLSPGATITVSSTATAK